MFSKYTEPHSYIEYLISIGRRTGNLSDVENKGENLTSAEHLYLVTLVFNKDDDELFSEELFQELNGIYFEYFRNQDEKQLLDDIKNKILNRSNSAISTLLNDHYMKLSLETRDDSINL